MQAKFNLENFKKSHYLGDLLVDGRILKFILKTQVVRGWIGFSRLEIGANDVLNVVKRELNMLLHEIEHQSGCTSSSLSHVCQAEVR